MQAQQRQAFSARLERIAAGAPNTMGTIYVGLEETFVYDRNQAMPGRPAGSRSAKLLRATWRIIGAFALGIPAVLLGKLADFHIMSRSGGTLEAGQAAMVTALFVLGAILLLRGLARLEGSATLVATLLGAIFVHATDHNLVHRYPAPFAAAFSPAWVQQIRVQTEPQTATFYQTTIRL